MVVFFIYSSQICYNIVIFGDDYVENFNCDDEILIRNVIKEYLVLENYVVLEAERLRGS